MTTIALSLPLSQSHGEALALSQQTAQHLQKYSPSRLPVPVPFLSSPESVELWASYEKLLLSCLRTGDDKGAHMCLEKLIERFGATNERVMGLRGLYQEAVADDDAALEKILEEYSQVLDGDSANTVSFEIGHAIAMSVLTMSPAYHEATSSTFADAQKAK